MYKAMGQGKSENHKAVGGELNTSQLPGSSQYRNVAVISVSVSR